MEVACRNCTYFSLDYCELYERDIDAFDSCDEFLETEDGLFGDEDDSYPD
jgi:hypothetical protein